MRPPVSRTVLLIVAAIMLLSLVAFRVMGVRGTEPETSPATTAVALATASPGLSAAAKPTASPVAQAKPTAAQASGQAKPAAAAQAKPTTAAAQAKPTTASQNTAQSPGQAPAQSKPSDPERARIVREATWTPGQLQDHFEKHGSEGPWASESVYDASARETVAVGTQFTYVDRANNAERLGFFDRAGNRFTSVTQDGRRITTHFRPDRGEAYVRGLFRSTYR